MPNHLCRLMILTVAAGLVSTAPAQPTINQPFVIGNDKDARMAWWRDARFGMFIHWGVYSQLGGEFEGRASNGTSEWIMESLHIPASKYETLADQFNPTNYDPRAWAKIAREAGMKYVVITSRHHDGFCLWDSQVSNWDITRTPRGEDLLAPLAKACRAEGMKFGLYYSIMDWHHPDYQPRRKWNDKAKGEPSFTGRFVPYVQAQVEELIRGYEPDVLWFDGEWEETWTSAMGQALEGRIRQLKPDVVINNRIGKSRDDMAGLDKPGAIQQGDFCTPEQEVPAMGLPGIDWETCMTMNTSWGYKAKDTRYKSAEQIVRTLIDVASKGGNFLLNVGPTPDGRIPQESIDRLRDVGTWMKLNGEAIYGTSASPFKRLPFGKATIKPGTLYLLVTDWPKNGELFLPGMKTAPKGAAILGQDFVTLNTTLLRDGVVITGVPLLPAFPFASVIKVSYDPSAPFVVDPFTVKPDEQGVFICTAQDADLTGRAKIENDKETPNIGSWTGEHSTAGWLADVPKAGRYRVELTLACPEDEAGDAFAVNIDGRELESKVPPTGSWTAYATVAIGEVAISVPSNRVVIRIKPQPGLKGALMNLRAVRLVPVETK